MRDHVWEWSILQPRGVSAARAVGRKISDACVEGVRSVECNITCAWRRQLLSTEKIAPYPAAGVAEVTKKKRKTQSPAAALGAGRSQATPKPLRPTPPRTEPGFLRTSRASTREGQFSRAPPPVWNRQGGKGKGRGGEIGRKRLFFLNYVSPETRPSRRNNHNGMITTRPLSRPRPLFPHVDLLRAG